MSEDNLDTIFDLLCKDFIRLLQDKSLSSADRKTLIEFLKDNNVKTNGAANAGIKNILGNLPFSEEETNVQQIKPRKY
jgi:hypothetical protein